MLILFKKLYFINDLNNTVKPFLWYPIFSFASKELDTFILPINLKFFGRFIHYLYKTAQANGN